MIKNMGKKRIYSKDFKDKNNIVTWDVMKIEQGQNLVLRFISTNSKHRQGVRIAIDAGNGYIEVNEYKLNEIYLWEDTAPKEVKMKCFSDEGLVSIYNVWYTERGSRSLSYKCGMIIEKNGNKIKYRCNDFGDNTNFDKLVFEIEII